MKLYQWDGLVAKIRKEQGNEAARTFAARYYKIYTSYTPEEVLNAWDVGQIYDEWRNKGKHPTPYKIKPISYKNNIVHPTRTKSYIPFMQGRPVRETIIQKDEITNLKIALNSSESFETFLQAV